MVALVGANGAGKTTLLKTSSGLLRPKKGAIHFNGERIDRLSPQEIVKKGLIHVPEGRKLFPEMSVLENLLMGAYASQQEGIERRLAKVYEIFPRLKEREAQLAGTLSGGEQQMVAIGRGLMGEPRLLMLDEPSLGLAPIMVEETFKVIEAINRGGVTVLLVEQNTQYALSLAHRGYVMEYGKVVLTGTGASLLQDESVKKAYLGL
jgi:branched-chain amino acid transport system ATP-binding protein